MRISEARIVVIDSESTGFEPSEGHRLLEIGAVCGPEYYQSYINPERDIPADASGVHNITAATVKDARLQQEVENEFYEWLTAPAGDHLDRTPDLLCAHNAAHDKKFLPRFVNFKWLCSYELAKRVWPDAPNYKNNTLRYWLAQAVDAGNSDHLSADLILHSAMSDAMITEYVLQETIAGYLAQGGVDDVDAIIAYSQSPYILKSLPFGKHRGQPISEIPLDYIRWWLRQPHEEKDRDIIYTLEREVENRKGMFSFA